MAPPVDDAAGEAEVAASRARDATVDERTEPAGTDSDERTEPAGDDDGGVVHVSTPSQLDEIVQLSTSAMLSSLEVDDLTNLMNAPGQPLPIVAADIFFKPNDGEDLRTKKNIEVGALAFQAGGVGTAGQFLATYSNSAPEIYSADRTAAAA